VRLVLEYPTKGLLTSDSNVTKTVVLPRKLQTCFNPPRPFLYFLPVLFLGGHIPMLRDSGHGLAVPLSCQLGVGLLLVRVVFLFIL
jgi:hypothetical protein